MIKFLSQNKLQFLIVVGVNLLVYTALIYAIAVEADKTDNMTLAGSIALGIFVTYYTSYLIKTWDLYSKYMIILVIVLYILILRYISTFILDPIDVLTVMGIILGVIVYIYVWHTADTIHNIRMKSRLILQDLDS